MNLSSSPCTHRVLAFSFLAAATAVLALPGAAQQPSGDKWKAGPELLPFKMTAANDLAGLTSMFTFGNTHSGGVAWVDYNGDLLPDLFIANGTGFDHYLYRNDGGGSFTDVSSVCGKPDLSTGEAGALYADIDNDGDEDIFVLVDSAAHTSPGATNDPAGGPNLLYVNQGNGTFVEEGAALGVVDPRGWRNGAAAFADYDGDGWIDLYLSTWAMNYPTPGVYDKCDRMLQNDQDGSFTESTSTTTTDADGLDGLACIFWDKDGDLDPDLYVGNISGGGPNPPYECDDIIYENNGNGTFSDVTSSSSGVGDDACAAMGIDVGDVNNDGYWDLYVTDINDLVPPPWGNPLYLGNASGTLSDNVADVAGVQAGNSWPCNFADFDRDGWIDLWVGALFSNKKDWLFGNNGNGIFSNRTPSNWGHAPTRGGSIADYDADGDVDVLMWNHNTTSILWRNDTNDPNNWMEFKLYGVSTNRSAIGTVVKVTAGGITQMRRVSGGDSAHSQQDAVLHFGVGDSTQADVSVLWPSGTVQNFSSVAVNDIVLIDEVGGILSEAITGHWLVPGPGGEVQVRVRSNHGGRTSLFVEGLGPLTYNAADTRWEGTFSSEALRQASGTRGMVVSSERGSWVVGQSTRGRRSLVR